MPWKTIPGKHEGYGEFVENQEWYYEHRVPEGCVMVESSFPCDSVYDQGTAFDTDPNSNRVQLLLDGESTTAYFCELGLIEGYLVYVQNWHGEAVITLWESVLTLEERIRQYEERIGELYLRHRELTSLCQELVEQKAHAPSEEEVHRLSWRLFETRQELRGLDKRLNHLWLDHDELRQCEES